MRINTSSPEREKTTILLPRKLKEKAQELGLNLSRTCENAIKNAVSLLSQSESPKQPFLSSGSAKESDVDRGGFEPPASAVRATSEIDWKGFEEMLRAKYPTRSDSYRFNCAFRYADCLLSGNYSEVQKLSKTKVPGVLRSLSALSKFVGLHDKFTVDIKRYGLSWAGRSADDLIIDRLNRSDDPEDVWRWCRDVKDCFPELREFMDLQAVTGLRFSETLNAYNLIIQCTREGSLAKKYYNNATGFIEHFRFRELFLRPSKKAFISYVPLELLDAIGKKPPMPVRNPIQKHFQRRHMPQRFGDVREANGTFMLKFLSETEVDVMQGRIGTSVFRTHYLNPKLIPDLRERCAQGAKEIMQKISVDVGAEQNLKVGNSE